MKVPLMTQPQLCLSIQVKDHEGQDLADALAILAPLGLDMAELPLHAMDIVMGARIRQDRLRNIRAITEDQDLDYAVHGHLGINLMEEPHRIGLHRDLLRANIEVAAELGAHHLVMHGGFCPAGQASIQDHAYARQREELLAMAPFARQHGVILCVENIFDFTGQRHTALPSRLAAELAAIDDPNVVATFDISHGWMHCHQMGADFLTEAKALAPWSKHLHLHDSFGRPNDFWTFSQSEALAFGAGDLHLPMGWGNMPWEALSEACTFPSELVADIETSHRYASAFQETVTTTRRWVERLFIQVPESMRG